MRIFPRIRVHRHKEHSVGNRPRVLRRPPTVRMPAAPPLLDLSQAVRAASSVEGLYQSLIDMVQQAFSVPAVSLFIREDEPQDFVCRVSTAPHALSEGAPPVVLASDSFVIRRLRSLSSPVHIDADELCLWQEALNDAPRQVFEKRMRERETLQRTCSSLLVQLRTKSDLVGVLSLGERPSGRFSSEERDLLKAVAGQLALVLENTKLMQRLVEHERLRAELAVAAEVQRNLLPATSPDLPGIELCGFCKPASQVGGDYYDFVSLGEDRAGICIADVAGKGIAAALLMSVVQASLRGQLFNGREYAGAGAVASMLNRLICACVSTARYVTCFYGQLNANDGSFRFVNAGHNPPLLLTNSTDGAMQGEFQRLSSGGTVLGMFPEAGFEEEVVFLRAGDILVAYTDGVTEAMNPQEEEFSEERLRAAILESSDRSAAEILNTIVARVSQWSKGAPQHDDLTLIVLRMQAAEVSPNS